MQIWKIEGYTSRVKYFCINQKPTQNWVLDRNPSIAHVEIAQTATRQFLIRLPAAQTPQVKARDA